MIGGGSVWSICGVWGDFLGDRDFMGFGVFLGIFYVCVKVF